MKAFKLTAYILTALIGAVAFLGGSVLAIDCCDNGDGQGW